ncbi:hypothetical protein HMPREF0880_02786 [Yokenella regensburgei ATCC 43003]|nr:hypothetical protein HMPREF0880_02786 [Yokenella regensburgei ATCC 43003]
MLHDDGSDFIKMTLNVISNIAKVLSVFFKKTPPPQQRNHMK